MDEKLVTIREYRTPWEARTAAARLESEGIPCAVDDEDAATVFGSAIDFVKLKVAESRREEAEGILTELEERAQEAAEEDEGDEQ